MTGWQRKSGCKKEVGRLHVKNSLIHPWSFQSSEALPLSFSLLSDCPWVFTHLKSDLYLN